MTRRLKASTPGHRNPTLTEGQLGEERKRQQQREHDAAVTICDRALAGGWAPADLIQVFRIVFDRDTLQRWGIPPDPVPSAAGKYQWGRAKKVAQ